MNDDAISRQVAINDIETVNPSMSLSINWVKNWIKTLPTAQPKQKKGKWMHTDIEPDEKDHYPLGWMPWYCSECGMGVGKHQTTFCPNCGAKMEGTE